MLVPMATVRTAPAPAQQFPIVAPPLPVQNGAQAGSKVSGDKPEPETLVQHLCLLLRLIPRLFLSPFSQIIQIAPMPVVQSQLPQAGAVHPANPFPVSVGAAAVVATGSAPSQAVLLPPAPTR